MIERFTQEELRQLTEELALTMPGISKHKIARKLSANKTYQAMFQGRIHDYKSPAEQQGIRALFSMADAICGNYVARVGRLIPANNVLLSDQHEYEKICGEILKLLHQLYEKHAEIRQKNCDKAINGDRRVIKQKDE